MESKKFEAHNGTYVELNDHVREDLQDAGFQTEEEMINFCRAMAAAINRAEKMDEEDQ